MHATTLIIQISSSSSTVVCVSTIKRDGSVWKAHFGTLIKGSAHLEVSFVRVWASVPGLWCGIESRHLKQNQSNPEELAPYLPSTAKLAIWWCNCFRMSIKISRITLYSIVFTKKYGIRGSGRGDWTVFIQQHRVRAKTESKWPNPHVRFYYTYW